MPLAVLHVGLAARHVLGMGRVHQTDLQAVRLQHLGHRDPVDPRGLHRHGRDPAGLEPLGHRVQLRGQAPEASHRPLVAVLGHRHVMLGRADVDPGGVGMDHRQGLGQARRDLRVDTAGTGSVECIINVSCETENQGLFRSRTPDPRWRGTNTLLNGIAGTKSIVRLHQSNRHGSRNQARNRVQGHQGTVGHDCPDPRPPTDQYTRRRFFFKSLAQPVRGSQ